MEKKCSCSRRAFLVSSTKAALGAAVCANLLSSCNKKPADMLGDDENKLVTVDVSNTDQYPDFINLAHDGGAAELPVAGLTHPLIIYRKSQSEYIVMFSACTHKGVKIDLPDNNGISECPNDHAKFDLKQKGKALTPAITSLDLKRFDCILTGTILTIYQS